MQSEVLDKHGSDCGTHKTIEMILTEKDSSDFKYRYIVDNDELVCLTNENMPKYIGKKIHLRSPLYCKGDKICNKCAGEMNYKLNNINIGLGCSKIATALLRLGMKKFHISNLKSKQIDVNDMLI